MSSPVITANSIHLGGPIRNASQHQRRPSRYDPISVDSDRTSIEFTRCLYQAKNIVKELQQFSESLCPAIKVSPFNGFSASSSLQDPRLSSTDFVGKVNRYLDDTFSRFSRLCRVLLLVLEKMERSPHVRRERVVSFRSEVVEQVRIAEITRLRIVSYIQHHVDESDRPFPRASSSPSSTTASSSSSSAAAAPPSSSTESTALLSASLPADSIHRSSNV
ncbi:hypothetical protein BX666DRAFT_1876092 [Dichotomocladium elegans]|nr:hypothetical protein BX666DRAFT_1876092 [Dichotomocladium elegans]